jgi:hypothetical protein
VKTFLCAALCIAPAVAGAQSVYTLPQPVLSQKDYYYDNGTGPFTYVSQAIKLLQAGGGGGGVTSFNSRTGSVTLSSADVIAALTYTPPSIIGRVGVALKVQREHGTVCSEQGPGQFVLCHVTK